MRVITLDRVEVECLFSAGNDRESNEISIAKRGYWHALTNM